VYQSTTDNLATDAATVIANGTVSTVVPGGNTNPDVDTDNITANNLTPETQYWFNVVVTDTAGNQSIYTAVSATTLAFSSLDTDGDGIPDDTEINMGLSMGGTDTQTADTDNDGVSDEMENSFANIDDTTTDTDGDGIPDYFEVINGTMTDSSDNSNDGADTDGDGIPDAIETVIGTPVNVPDYYGGGTDTDGDGISDALETYIQTTFGISPIDANTDTDGDGIPDALETIRGYIPTNANSPIANGGNDTTGNVGTSPSTAVDTDLVTDAVEWYLANLGGTPTIVTPVTTYSDSDGDGLPDALEISIGSNPQDANSPTANGSNAGTLTSTVAVVNYLTGLGVPSVNQYTDTDRDLVPDVVEVALGTDPFGIGTDSDGDGIEDAAEYYLANNGGSAALTTTIGQDIDGDLVPDRLDISLALGTRFNNAALVASDESSLCNWMVAYDAGNDYTRAVNLSTCANGGENDSDGDGVNDKTELATGFNPFVADVPYGIVKVWQDNVELFTVDRSSTTTVSLEYDTLGYYNNPSITYTWYLDDDMVNSIGSSRTASIDTTTLSYGLHKATSVIIFDGVTYTAVAYFMVADSVQVDSHDKDRIANEDDTINQHGLNPNAIITRTTSVIMVLNKDDTPSNPMMIVRAGLIAMEYKKSSANVRSLLGQMNSSQTAVILPENTIATVVNEVFDFEVFNILPRGETEVKVIIPLEKPLPADAEYYKLTNSGNWQLYNKTMETASRVNNSCYDAGVVWVNGVVTGKDCFRITLVDGDPIFDLDGGKVDGNIIDPGMFAIPNDGSIAIGDRNGAGSGDGQFEVNQPGGATSGTGGCVLSDSSNQQKFDPTLYLLLLLSGVFMFRRKIAKVVGLVLLVTATFNSNASTTDTEYYIGLGVGKSSIKPVITSAYTHSKTSDTARQLTLGARLDYEENSQGQLDIEFAVIELGSAQVKNSVDKLANIPYQIKTLGVVFRANIDSSIKPFIGTGYRHISSSNENVVVLDRGGYYLKAGIDISVSEEQGIDLRLSYNSYSRDAKASFVSIVKKF
jgi:hypothetical protein